MLAKKFNYPLKSSTLDKVELEKMKKKFSSKKRVELDDEERKEFEKNNDLNLKDMRVFKSSYTEREVTTVYSFYAVVTSKKRFTVYKEAKHTSDTVNELKEKGFFAINKDSELMKEFYKNSFAKRWANEEKLERLGWLVMMKKTQSKKVWKVVDVEKDNIFHTWEEDVVSFQKKGRKIIFSKHLNMFGGVRKKIKVKQLNLPKKEEKKVNKKIVDRVMELKRKVS